MSMLVMLTLALVAVLAVVQAYVLFGALFMYYPLVGAVAARLFPTRARQLPAAPPPRLAVLVAACNESAVIAPTVHALMQQQYPASGYDVFVVADNCTDDTAAVARRAGATVYERFSDTGRTKGQALAWLWGYVKQFGYGGVVVVDADNEADPAFLRVIASELASGYLAVQGLRRPKASHSATAGLDALTELCTHRVGAAGRRALGLNGPLMGSGVGYDVALFDELINDIGETVVEDCEWQARLALRGQAIHWTPEAVVHDEKTSQTAAMGRQRDRWMAGRGQVARAYVLPLLKAFFTRGNLSALDMAGFLVTPPRSLTLAAMGAFWLAALAFPRVPGLWPQALWLSALAGFGVYVLAGLWLDDAPASQYRALGSAALQLPRFTLQMAGATWKALRGVAVKWVPTPHGPAPTADQA